MNFIKVFILELFCFSNVRLKWVNGDLSTDPYTIQEATFQLYRFYGYEYAEVETGLFKGWRIYK